MLGATIEKAHFHMAILAAPGNERIMSVQQWQYLLVPVLDSWCGNGLEWNRVGTRAEKGYVGAVR